MQPWLKLWFEPNFPQTSWGRNLHFLFAWVFVVNGAIYVAAALVSGYVRRRLLPSREQLQIGNVMAELRAHLKWRRPAATGRPDYNVLQKTAYLVVIFVLAPLTVLTGLTMSPGFVAALPELTTLFGGRQSARSIHFIAANLLVLFLVAHLLEVALAGGVAMLRAMVTGSVRVREGQS
jgi:thiosulfate reductase cytochrome b subunit